ncbi:MAG: alpha/beta hydrolase-fold protein [Pseudomonadota bacterium]
MNRPLLFLVFALALTEAAPGQLPAPIVSPEVLPDRRVIFRLSATSAAAVAFKGDWLDELQPMSRAPDGTWSLTVGPLAPSTYIYNFVLDGTTIADPVNPRIKLRMRGSGSLVEVPAETPGVAEARDVPHGTIEINWQRSAVLDGAMRVVWVYTPPGYTAAAGARYPVLYLLHGINDRPAGWIDAGNLNFIADNLIAEKKMAPMILVLPVGHALPFGQPSSANTPAFEEYLLRDVMPLVEARYRVAAGRENRAIAGFSMGAEQSLHVFFNHPDLFASLGAFSPAGFPALETAHAAILADPADTNAKIRLLWIGCGRQDAGHFAGSQRIADVLAAHQIRHVWHPTEGVHNYTLLREYLAEFLPLLFRPGRG